MDAKKRFGIKSQSICKQYFGTDQFKACVNKKKIGIQLMNMIVFVVLFWFIFFVKIVLHYYSSFREF